MIYYPKIQRVGVLGFGVGSDDFYPKKQQHLPVRIWSCSRCSSGKRHLQLQQVQTSYQ